MSNATGLNVKLKDHWDREHVIEELSQQACPSLSLFSLCFSLSNSHFLFHLYEELDVKEIDRWSVKVEPTAVLGIFLLRFVLLGEIAVLARLCGRLISPRLSY